MQVVLNVGFVALVSLATSFLLLAKLHRQLSHMIEGRIYQEHSQNWSTGVHVKYRASSKELMLHIASFSLLGIAMGLLVYVEQPLLTILIVGVFAILVFYLLVKEIRRNFLEEERRNRAAFEERERH